MAAIFWLTGYGTKKVGWMSRQVRVMSLRLTVTRLESEGEANGV